MTEQHKNLDQAGIQELYEESVHWHVNVGGKKVHPKGITGRFRSYKNAAWLFWFAYFILPYIKIGGQQIVLFDIPNRLFHFFGATVYPQDIWMLSFVLIFLAMTLFGVTAIAGRVFCGYWCFQTVWTDWFVRIETMIEGPPLQRRKLDEAGWSLEKVSKRALKYTVWALISWLTGVTFAAYFTDAYQLWIDLFTLQADIAAWITILSFFFGTFILAGFMREQVCFWLCPYARIQSVMVDKDTIIPTYDVARGEPRGKIKSKGEGSQGDCIDCKVCVAVCPTGVDIREGFQEGCITCGLCIDACDAVMDKINKPQGLIRYASQKEMQGAEAPPMLKRPRVVVYIGVIVVSVLAIVYGLATIPSIDWNVQHERQPLYTQMSDGSIQNMYTMKILNKTPEDMRVNVSVIGIEGVRVEGIENEIVLKPNKMVPFTVKLKAMPENVKGEKVPVKFIVKSLGKTQVDETHESFFVMPPH